MALSVTWRESLSATLSDGNLSDPAKLPSNGSLADGTGNGFADIRYQASGVLHHGATLALTLDDGSLKDGFGYAIFMTRLKIVKVVNSSTDMSCDLEISFFGGDAYENISIDLPLQPGGDVTIKAPNIGYAVGTGLTDHFAITNLSNTATASYSLLLIGATA